MNNGFNRVAEISVLYWVIKIFATTLGETGADVFSMTLDLGYGASSIIFLIMLTIATIYKMLHKKYSPLLYWVVFTLTGILGTAMCDYMDRTLNLGYALGSIVLVVVLIMTLAIWRLSEKSLSVKNVSTSRAELFYWFAFLVANTLGTAVGDYLADDLELGFVLSAAIISSLLIATAVAHYATKISPVFLFWCAFVLTRPFGATFGDFLTKSTSDGGVNLGTIGSSLLFSSILCIAIFIEMRLHRRRNK